MTRLTAYLLAATFLCGQPLLGDDAAPKKVSPEQREFFEAKIRPVLVEHCYECHSGDAAEPGGKLMLDTTVQMLKGGESGPAVVAGNPDASPLVQALKFDGLEMPPSGPLSEAIIANFVTWVKMGAPDPRAGDKPKTAEKAGPEYDIDPAELWSFFPRKKPAVPEVKNSSWPYDPIDHFVLNELEQRNLSPTQESTPRELIRRLYQDLIGLPPTHEQIESFEAACQADRRSATESLVDNLLSRPQFGERWGQHWLDIARYGESNGDDGLGRNASFPHAWRYRDYVIQALNEDLPYDRFLTEQIAGDKLPFKTAEERNRYLVATGYLAIGSKPAAAMNNNFAMDIVDDQINAICKGVIGLSVACARCHDHKHDPIPTSDYYALAGIFTSTQTLYGLAANEKLTAPPTPLHKLIADTENADWEKVSRQTPKFPENYHSTIDALNPVIHESLAQPPQNVSLIGEPKFSPEQFGQLKQTGIRGNILKASDSYTVAFWFKNNLKNNSQPITAYLFSRAKHDDGSLPGDHIGIGGKHDAKRTGKLFVFNGNAQKKSLAGETVIPPGTWNHLVYVRNGNKIELFLNGSDQPEISGELPATFGDNTDYTLGTRSEKFAHLDGNLAEFSVFNKALDHEQVIQLHAASGQPKPPQVLGLAMGVQDKAKPDDCKINIKGESKNLGPVAPRGIPSAYASISGWQSTVAPKFDNSSSGRLELAKWLTDPDHPQTARVMANRIWMHLYGQAIVSTPDDFGVYGAEPTHPELLDHLANRFVEGGWSLKSLIRSIVLTRTYQLSSQASAESIAADPNNTYYARHLRRRLDAETLRDAMLFVSGKLDPNPRIGSDIDDVVQLINWPPGESSNLHKPSLHRSIYLSMLRHAPPPEIAAFDLPDRVELASQREVTTLPTHGLFLINNPFVFDQANALAKEILASPETSDDSRIHQLFVRILQRNPTDEERKDSLKFLEDISASLESFSTDASANQQSRWASLSQALLMSNEFRYVD